MYVTLVPWWRETLYRDDIMGIHLGAPIISDFKRKWQWTLASRFCIPEPLTVHTSINRRQVHPLFRFYAKEPRTCPWPPAMVRVVAWGHNVSVPSIRDIMGTLESATTWTPSQPCGTAMLASNRVSDNCCAKVVTFPLPQRKFADLCTRRDHRWVHRCWR